MYCMASVKAASISSNVAPSQVRVNVVIMVLLHSVDTAATLAADGWLAAGGIAGACKGGVAARLDPCRAWRACENTPGGCDKKERRHGARRRAQRRQLRHRTTAVDETRWQ